MSNNCFLRRIVFPCMLCGCAALLRAEHPGRPLPRLKVSADHRFLVREDGKPFFYLADTGWEMFHRLDRKDAAEYLKIRAGQGYTVVQAVALAEFDGLTEPNAYGKLPLDRQGPDPAGDHSRCQPVHVRRIRLLGPRGVRRRRGQPEWHLRRTAAHMGALGGEESAQRRVHFHARPPRNSTASSWGSASARRESSGSWAAIARPTEWRTSGGPWRAGIAIGVSGKEDYDAVLMGFHPRGGGTSSTWFHNDAWLDVNMQQTGHGLADRVQAWAQDREGLRPPAGEAGDRCGTAVRRPPPRLSLRAERIQPGCTRPPAGLLGPVLRRMRADLRQPRGLAVLRARQKAGERTADVLARGSPPSGSHRDAVLRAI